MTEQERQQQFAAAVDALAQRFGVQLVARIDTTPTLDPAVRTLLDIEMQVGKVSAVVGLQLIPDWKQPAELPVVEATAQ